jgi:hypothetical protein
LVFGIGRKRLTFGIITGGLVGTPLKLFEDRWTSWANGVIDAQVGGLVTWFAEWMRYFAAWPVVAALIVFIVILAAPSAIELIRQLRRPPRIFRVGLTNSTTGPLSNDGGTTVFERFTIEIWNDSDQAAKNCFAYVDAFTPNFVHIDRDDYPQEGDPIPWLVGDEALHKVTIPARQSRRLLVALQATLERNTFLFPVSQPRPPIRVKRVSNMADFDGYTMRLHVGTEEIPSLPTSVEFTYSADDRGHVVIEGISGQPVPGTPSFQSGPTE